MKKLIKALLIISMCFGIVGCGEKKDESAKYDWDFYEKVTKKAEKKGYDFSYIIDDDKKNPDYMVLYDGTDGKDTTTWEKGIKVQLMTNVMEEINNSHVIDCRFYDADYEILPENEDNYESFFLPNTILVDKNDMVLVYSSLEVSSYKAVFYTGAQNFNQFLDFISGIGLSTVEELNSYCDMFFMKANQQKETDSKPKIEHTSDTNCINVTVGDTFGGDIDFEPIDDIENYDFEIECDKEFIEFIPEENSLKALKAGETEVQFYAISKITKEEIKSNTFKVIIKEPTTDD